MSIIVYLQLIARCHSVFFYNNGKISVLVWKDYFMAQARLAAKRSKDPVCKVGATIVTDSNVIVGTGYNCMPQGKDSDFTWDKNNSNFLKDKGSFGRYIIKFLNIKPLSPKNKLSFQCAMQNLML